MTLKRAPDVAPMTSSDGMFFLVVTLNQTQKYPNMGDPSAAWRPCPPTKARPRPWEPQCPLGDAAQGGNP